MTKDPVHRHHTDALMSIDSAAMQQNTETNAIRTATTDAKAQTIADHSHRVPQVSHRTTSNALRTDSLTTTADLSYATGVGKRLIKTHSTAP